MNAMLADLENALEVEVARAGRSTGEATTVLDSVPRRQRIVTSRRVSIAGILLVLAATAAALLIAGLSGEDRQRGRTGQRRRRRARPTGAEVELTGAQDFDPEGDNDEHADEVKLAIDGIPNTTWSTETYTAGPDLSPRRQDRRRADRRDRGAGRAARRSRSAPPRAAGTRRSTPPPKARRPTSRAGATRSARSPTPRTSRRSTSDVPEPARTT